MKQCFSLQNGEIKIKGMGLYNEQGEGRSQAFLHYNPGSENSLM